jgi:hypothetical protein
LRWNIRRFIHHSFVSLKIKEKLRIDISTLGFI